LEAKSSICHTILDSKYFEDPQLEAHLQNFGGPIFLDLQFGGPEFELAPNLEAMF
jgi:hypothetical protein